MEGSNPVKSFGPAKGLNASKLFDRIRFRDVAALVGAIAVLLLAMGVSSVSYKLHKEGADALDNHARVEENSELTYYLTVNEDGVDSTGKQSSDTVTANISGGMTSITDRLPDGLEFVGFVATEDGTIGAAARSDSSIACGGHVIDDTKEEKKDGGTWNSDHTEYYYHGLHYNAETRTVSFRVENVQAGCGLTVGIVTKTPSLGTNKRLDFYNTATLNEGVLNLNSNTMHTWMGRNGLTDYSVTYSYTGDVPASAPAAPEEQKYVDGANVAIAPSPIVDGYQFSGWTTSDTETELGHFTMPASNVAFTGSFTASTAQKYNVTYVIDGDAPADYAAPKAKQYAAGSTVLLDATRKGNQIDDYTFEGWTSEDVELDETGFVMPSQDIEIHGTFTRTTYSVTYAFQGDILPPNADSLLPETKEYPAGAKVERAANPTADGYRFTGWYKNESFVMPAENVTIYGEWSQIDGVFTPELTIKTMGEPKKYMLGDTVMFEIEVKNTADYPIKDIQLLEQMDGAVFVDGEGYTPKTDTYALVDEIPAGGSVKVYAEYKLEEDTEDTFTNTVVLTGAIADGNYALDTSRDYTASVDFETQYYVEPEEKEEQEKEAENAKTLDRIVSYVIVAITGLAGIIASIFMARKTLQNEQFKTLLKTKQQKKQDLKELKQMLGGKKLSLKDSFAAFTAKLDKRHLMAFALADVALIAGAVAFAIYQVPKIQENADPSTISFMSSRADYENGDPGAWKLTKSAKWTGDGEAELTIDVDTIAKTADNRHTDILYVVDVSGSMNGSKLDKVKQDMTELTESLLSDTENRVAMVSFESSARKELDFTSDKDTALTAIDNLTTSGCTNYYQALKNAGELLETYEHQNNRELIMLFLTDGYPNEDTPNEQTEYAYLKETYPFMTVNAIQYEMDSEILEPIKAISDTQYIADMDSLNNVLFEASIAPYTYSEFTVEDVMSEYFYIDNTEEIVSIVPSLGTAELSEQDGLQKITWKMDGLIRSGTSQSLTIKIKIQDAYKRVGGEYPTNTGESVSSKIEGVRDESVESDETPVLRSNYYVRYEANAPSDCTPVGVPEGQAEHFVYEVVEIESNVPTCQGYNFNGWAITTTGIRKLNDDYFRMPGQDVTFRATWTKADIKKSMDGTVHEETVATLAIGQTVNQKMKRLSGQSSATYSTSNTTITGIERADELPANVDTTSSNNMISSSTSKLPIYAWFDNGTIYYYTQADKVSMDANPSRFFYELRNLADIGPIADWDTSSVTDMSSMFYGTTSLAIIDALSNWDTSSVTNMSYMFYNASGLTNIDGASNWDTSKVTNMQYMFRNASNLTNIDALSNWDTSNVTNMSYMFNGAKALTDIDGASNWNTSSVTDMSYMFSSATGLTNIDGASGWDTSKVTSMYAMFYSTSIASTDALSEWDTSKVTSMKQLFHNAQTLSNIGGLANWDTSNVTDMSHILNSTRITSLDALRDWNTAKVSTLYQSFGNNNYLTDIDGVNNWNTSNVNNMNYIFSSTGITDLGALSRWNTSKVTNMSGAFRYTKIENVDGLINWDVSNVTTISSIFENDTWLQNLNGLANWNTSNITDMNTSFGYATSLADIDGISNWNTSNVNNMNKMFSSDKALRSVDALSEWNTSNVTNMEFMFNYAEGLLDISGLEDWDTSNVTTMKTMFRYIKTPNLDALSDWDIKSVTDLTYMFEGIEATDINGLQYWDVSSITNMQALFLNAKLVNLDALSSWNTSSVVNMTMMFEQNNNLEDISGIEDWDTSKVTTMSNMFYNDTKITDLSPLNNWNTANVTNKSNMFYGIPSSVTRPTWF